MPLIQLGLYRATSLDVDQLSHSGVAGRGVCRSVGEGASDSEPP